MRKYIGIDPDCEKSGVALLEKKKLTLNNFTFFELYEYFIIQKDICKFGKNELIVIIEGGWLNKSTWHGLNYFLQLIRTPQKAFVYAAKIGKNTGANHETGRKIVEMCEYLNLKYEVIKPTKTKVNSEYFCKLTGIKKSNQEQRDAAMLILGR